MPRETCGEEPLNTGPTFWLIIATGVAVLIGVGLAYGLIARRGRRTQETDRPKEERRKDRS